MSIVNVDDIRRKALDLLEARNGSSLDADETESLIDFFRANKFPLLALGSREKLDEQWQNELSRASASYTEQREEYLKVRVKWLELGIECMAFKSAGTRPSFPYTSDNLDILIRRRDQAEAIRVLKELRYVWLANTDEREKLLFRKFHGGRCVSAIHLHTWIGWDAEFHEEEAVWARARSAPDDPDVTVPSPEDAILVNVAHALYENKQFSLFDMGKIRAHWARADLDWRYMEGIARRRGWLDGLYFGLAVAAFVERHYFGRRSAPAEARRHWLDELRKRPALWWYYRRLTRNRKISLPFKVSFAFSKALYYKKIASDQHDKVGQRAANLMDTLAWGVKQKSGLNPQPGMLVAFSGVDGAGKSRHATALSDALTTCGVMHRRVWSRPGCSPLYRAIARLVRGGGAAEAPPERAGTERRAPGGKVARLLWTMLNVLDLSLLYNWSARRRILVGNVIVCDRYATDAEVELASRLPEGDRLARRFVRLLGVLSPEPSMGFLLDLPADQAVQRSADREFAQNLEERRRDYLEAAARRDMMLLDASGDFDDLSDEIVCEALRTYFVRFDTLLNGLLLSNPGQLNVVAGRLLREDFR